MITVPSRINRERKSPVARIPPSLGHKGGKRPEEENSKRQTTGIVISTRKVGPKLEKDNTRSHLWQARLPDMQPE